MRNKESIINKKLSSVASPIYVAMQMETIDQCRETTGYREMEAEISSAATKCSKKKESYVKRHIP